MSSKLTVATLMVGSVGTLLNESQDARRKAREASRTARDAARVAEDWDRSGDKDRLTSGIVRDLQVGLSIPAAPGPVAPSAFASPSATISRPSIGEGDLGVAEYPPRVNQYNADGDLLSPQAAAENGAMVVPGLAMTFDEIRALFCGSTFPTVPTQQEMIAMFRHNRGLVTVLRELGTLAQPDASEAWRRFFGSASKRVFWNALEDSATIGSSATGTETYTSFVLPADALRVGETLVIEYAIRMAGGVNCTVQPLVETEGGIKLWSPYNTYNPGASGGAASHTMIVRIEMTRRANDSSGGRKFAVSGSFLTQSGEASSNDPTSLPVITLDTSIDQKVLIRNVQGTADMNSYVYRGTAKVE